MTQLSDLPDRNWSAYEKRRFLKDSTKQKVDGFDPEAFKHDGFEDAERYREAFVPALARPDRLSAELNNFTPPRLGSINDSPYQALVIRYGILRQLIQQHDYELEKESLLEAVQAWQRGLIDDFTEEDFPETDDLLHLGKAAVDYNNDLDDSELHLLHSYFEIRNRARNRKHEYFTWLDLFKRLAAIDRFPKVSRSEKPEHALDTIEKGLWSLQEQAIVFEIVHPDRGDLVGIPEDYVEFIRDWLYYEMSDENYLTMLESIDAFDHERNLVDARRTFGVTSPTQGLNDKRRESLVKAGIYPSELLHEVMDRSELKAVVDRYSIDAHRGKPDEMVERIIEYFEQSQRYSDVEDPGVELWLTCFEDIADGRVERVPPQLQGTVVEEDADEKLDILFERATGEIFEEAFNLSSTSLKGQTSSGIVADGEIEQGGKWLLWDNKRRQGQFRFGSDTQAKIRNYIDRKAQQHDVEWFVIIAPEFNESAVTNANTLETQIGVDIRLVRAEDFARLAEYWLNTYASADRELPLSIFYGSDLLDLNVVKESLSNQFS